MRYYSGIIQTIRLTLLECRSATKERGGLLKCLNLVLGWVGLRFELFKFLEHVVLADTTIIGVDSKLLERAVLLYWRPVFIMKELV